MIVIHSLQGGGAERVAVDMAAYWQACGCQVSVVTQTDASDDAYTLPEGVTRHALRLAGETGGGLPALWGNLRRLLALRRLVRRHRPTVVLGMMTRSSILAVAAAHGRCRVIVTEHTHPPIQSLPAMWQRLRRWAYPRADAVVALTHGTAQWLDDEIPGVQAQVIPNAVRWPLEDGAPPVVAADKAPGRLRLLAVGRLHRVKGFDCLLRAFAPLAPLFPDWDLVILGEGGEREALEALCQELGLEGRVSLPGRVGNVGVWYQASDLYVLSSVAEGLSNTLLEAMASGLPCVAFDCDTGPREIIRDGIDGVLVQPVQDVEALAARLSELMADPGLRARYADRAVDVRDRFSTARVMALWGQVFRGNRVN